MPAPGQPMQPGGRVVLCPELCESGVRAGWLWPRRDVWVWRGRDVYAGGGLSSRPGVHLSLGAGLQPGERAVPGSSPVLPADLPQWLLRRYRDLPAGEHHWCLRHGRRGVRSLRRVSDLSRRHGSVRVDLLPVSDLRPLYRPVCADLRRHAMRRWQCLHPDRHVPERGLCGEQSGRLPAECVPECGHLQPGHGPVFGPDDPAQWHALRRPARRRHHPLL